MDPPGWGVGEWGDGALTYPGPFGNVPTFRVSILAKFQKTVQSLGKNSRTGVSRAHDFPEQVKFIVMTLLLVKTLTLYISFPE